MGGCGGLGDLEAATLFACAASASSRAVLKPAFLSWYAVFASLKTPRRVLLWWIVGQ